jgi:signal peptidase II
MAQSQPKNKRHIAILITAMCFIIVDRFLKILALTSGQTKILVKNWLDFALIKNANAALSLNFGFDILWLAIIITLLALVWLNYSLQKKDYFKSAVLTALILGAISNIYDRLNYGAVIDYFSFANLSIFNLADCLIVISAALLIWQEFKNQKAS